MAFLRQRRLSACLCMCLLLAAVVASAAVRPLGNTVTDKDGICYKTATMSPKECGGQFITALFNKSPISPHCCLMLWCVMEWSCEPVLSGLCPNPGVGPILPGVCPHKSS